MGDHWVMPNLLAAAMLGVAVYCTARLVVSFRSPRRTQRDTDAVHAVMGVSMAGMLSPSLTAVPSGVWLVVFSVSALWFGWRGLRESDRGPAACHELGSDMTHLLMCGAMVYMLAVMDWSGSAHAFQGAGMLGMGTVGAGAAEWSIIAVLLTLLIFGDVAFNAGATLRLFAPLTVSSGGERASGQVGHSGVSTGQQRGHSPTMLAQRSAVLAPRSAVLCQLVMCLAMGYMLVTLS
jgi:Domain of unknown function (DUF5134)